ncbi:acetylornithine/N-succinyldiaminopimelate aminotransferase [Rhodothalassium salexigens DSM 2132]|uniref:Acetylornithine aminotransferase n=2 Tax=Rhodothalassium salexigens TaxID=1086 RepID=A0A4R2PKT7_RHOSA|nr:aspartate aminotransferase family protein [Rhodothalassium salexigens]MBB4211142.1 acetylornithine/N-succinyldiaminopimelate aminotransferase [Rhodothalassium salexigens DSM 2132]TCP36202.1 acetylornithine/N-succinyldiaminopimelate aminotransferase [Rhodothalassium salexigens DSM 2132]
MTSALMGTYRQADVAFERGEGMTLYDDAGKAYLDFNAGIAVSCLGHAHPHLVATLKDQAEKLWHTSNLYRIAHAERLAERLCAASFADRVFFTNSGAEAIECAIKTARRYFFDQGEPDRYEIVTLTAAFHGRTLAAVAAAGKAEGFGPATPGFRQVVAGAIEDLTAAIGPQTAAVMLEPVQGEGGVVPLPDVFLRDVRRICDERGLLLIADEIQCGMGRTGKLFAHEWADIRPDIVAAAKGIGGGFPLGACLATDAVAAAMVPGTHGSTYGGNPLATAVGNAVLDELLKPGFMGHVIAMGEALHQALAHFAERYHNQVEDMRGRGLMWGIKLRDGLVNREVVATALRHGLLTAPAGDNVIRLLPPLILTQPHIDQAMERLGAALTEAEQTARTVA